MRHWTPSPLLQRTIDRSALFMLPDCCCGSEILIVCHSKGETPAGTGSVSRLDPATGAVLWTADLGTDSASSRPRVGYRCAFDSSGAVYVVWMTSSDADGKLEPLSFSGSPAGGVAKLAAADGAQLAFVEFALKNASGGTVLTRPPRIVVDTAHDRIYATCDYDADGFWLYRLDTSLAIAWGAGPAETDPAADGRGVGLTLNPANGQIFAANTESSSIFRFDPDGTLVGSVADLDRPFGLAFDPVRGLRAGGHITSLGDALFAGYDASFAFDWQLQLTAFDVLTAAGSWNASPTTEIFAAVEFGGVLIFGGTPTEWDVTAGGTRYASLWFADTFGTVLFPEARGWGSWNGDAVPSTTYDIAHNPITGMTYVVGHALSGAEKRFAHQLGPSGWLAPILTDPSTGNAWGVAVRS